MENELNEATLKDHGRGLFMNYLIEIGGLVAAINYDAQNLKTWMKDNPAEVSLTLAPGRAFTRYEPLGVVAVIGAWNAPYSTTLKPLSAAIAAGNCVIVKPSEMSPNTSAVMKKLCDKYLDKDFIATFEGGPDVAIAVNNLPLDYLCFTGSTRVGKIVA